ncbi:MAG: glycosyltransferase, partial [Spirochaetia bacterium]|nr:glycosyltransferase [Spirochaetia bacterium]
QKTADWPGRISILIPARNEEKNILRLLESIDAEREIGRLDLEVIVLDDHSTDLTRETVAASPGYGFYVHLVEGKPLPPGWTGKNWACHQLSQRAKGEILLFIDADVSYSGEAVAKTLSLFQNEAISLVSVFPRQKTGTHSEKLLIPFIDFLLQSFLPLPFVTFFKSHLLSAANGQWLAFRAEAYRRIGGHESVKGEVLEDMRLAQKIKRLGEKMITAVGGEAPVCRMYRGLPEVWAGLSKNTFALLGGNFFQAAAIWTTLFFLDLLPWILLGMGNLWALPWIASRLLARILISNKTNWPHLLLHPIGVAFFLILVINSFRWHRKGRVFWKGRTIAVGKLA